MNTPALALLIDQRPIGTHWDAFPGISAYGVLRRAWRLNQLHRSELRATLGVNLTSHDDVFHRSLLSDVLKDRLSRVYPEVDPSDWELTAWWPFGGPFPKAAFTPMLRECPSCARSCYHTLLFQMPGMTHCPWHGDALITTCPRCERRLQAGLRESLPPGRCVCGHDLVDEVAAIVGDEAVRANCGGLDRFGAWARSYRQSHWLVAPEVSDPEADAALAALVGRELAAVLPSQPWPRDSPVVLETIRMAHPPGPSQLLENSGLEQFKPTTACLPVAWYPAMREIAAAVIAMMPAKARRESMRPTSELRSVLGQLPDFTVGSSVFLQTECLDRAVLRCLGRLASALRRAPAGAKRFPEAEDLAAAVAANQPVGAALVERVLQRVLLRGYADGTRISIGRHVPEFYDPGRPRPVRRYPWVELDLSGAAKIAWSRQSGTI